MEKWITLASNEIGIHKMEFKDHMLKEDAIILGKDYCKHNNLEYAGTYSREEIHVEENKLTRSIYLNE